MYLRRRGDQENMPLEGKRRQIKYVIGGEDETSINMHLSVCILYVLYPHLKSHFPPPSSPSPVFTGIVKSCQHPFMNYFNIYLAHLWFPDCDLTRLVILFSLYYENTENMSSSSSLITFPYIYHKCE